jgi:hypothetical protein
MGGIMKTVSKLAICLALCFGFSFTLVMTARAADDKKEDKSKSASATGTWKYTVQTQNGDEFTSTIKLKQDHEKVTGTVTGRQGNETEIKDGKLKDSEISFTVVRKFGDNEVTIKYKGKLSEDAIKGAIEFTGADGQSRSMDWNAKREKEEGKAASASAMVPAKVAGNWSWSVPGQNGDDFKISMKVKQEGSKLTGTESFNDDAVEIQEGKVEGSEVSFKVTRKFGDTEIHATYKGKVSGDTIKGNVEVNVDGNPQSREWEAKRDKA